MHTTHVTLAADATITVISDVRIAAGSVVVLVPLTHNASANACYCHKTESGKAFINHPSGFLDLDFNYYIVGGTDLIEVQYPKVFTLDHSEGFG